MCKFRLYRAYRMSVTRCCLIEFVECTNSVSTSKGRIELGSRDRFDKTVSLLSFVTVVLSKQEWYQCTPLDQGYPVVPLSSSYNHYITKQHFDHFFPHSIWLLRSDQSCFLFCRQPTRYGHGINSLIQTRNDPVRGTIRFITTRQTFWYHVTLFLVT